MLENSYDASGIKFGILISPNLKHYFNDSKIDTQMILKIVNMDTCRIIDFSNIDGLTISEAIEINPRMYADDSILFLIYNQLEYEGSGTIMNQKDINLRGYLVLVRTKDNSNTPIDEIIEKTLLDNYKGFEPDGKRLAKCFLQRYRYGSKERTDNIIDEKVFKKQQQ